MTFLRDYERWLTNQQWRGYPLAEILGDSIVPEPDIDDVEPENYRALRSLLILTNGLAGETGEALEHFKKFQRDGGFNKRAVGLELGDVLNYLIWLAHVAGFTLEDIAFMSKQKLEARGKKEGS